MREQRERGRRQMCDALVAVALPVPDRDEVDELVLVAEAVAFGDLELVDVAVAEPVPDGVAVAVFEPIVGVAVALAVALFVAEFVARVLVSVAVADAVAVTVPLPVLVAVALLETVGEALALALGNLRERHATCAPLKCATVTPV